MLKSKAHESVSLNWISMHRPWAAVEALLLPGLRLCICFFICNKLMCFDNAPLWEVADRQCQYFLLKKKPKPNPTSWSVALQYAFQNQMMEHAGWKLPPGENIANTTRAFPASLEAIFCYLLFFFSSSEKKGSVNIHCIFGSCWTRLYWCLSWAVVLCSSFQESGTQNLEIGMKVRKIKSRHLEDCFFLVS